jgi:hypothetical protein
MMTVLETWTGILDAIERTTACYSNYSLRFFYLSLDSVILHYPATNKKKRREYILA